MITKLFRKRNYAILSVTFHCIANTKIFKNGTRSDFWRMYVKIIFCVKPISYCRNMSYSINWHRKSILFMFWDICFLLSFRETFFAKGKQLLCPKCLKGDNHVLCNFIASKLHRLDLMLRHMSKSVIKL